ERHRLGARSSESSAVAHVDSSFPPPALLPFPAGSSADTVRPWVSPVEGRPVRTWPGSRSAGPPGLPSGEKRGRAGTTSVAPEQEGVGARASEVSEARRSESPAASFLSMEVTTMNWIQGCVAALALGLALTGAATASPKGGKGGSGGRSFSGRSYSRTHGV